MCYFYKIVLCFVLLGFSISVPAQNLPALQKDGAVSTGTLQNGITYYLVTNSTTKGVADFALVRKGCSDTLASREELVSLPHFNKTIPYRFLSRKGIGCRPEGYMTYGGGNTVYRFDDVPVFDQAASDTTLLLLFDLIAAQPCQHAVVIAGDITPAALLERMKVFSMMVPSRNPGYTKEAYSFKPSDGTLYSFTESARPSLKVEFRSPRTPDAQMNTIQPFISRLYALELKEIVDNRLGEVFSERGIPALDLATTCLGSAETSGDERFTVEVVTSPDQLVQATLAVASVLSEIGSRGVDGDEYRTAKSTVISRLGHPRSNDDLVRQSISSYLYGSDLASTDTKVKFLISRPMDADTEARLFNNYISAILSDTDNMSVSWTGTPEEYGVLSYELLFKAMWNSVAMLDTRTYQRRRHLQAVERQGKDQVQERGKRVRLRRGDMDLCQRDEGHLQEAGNPRQVRIFPDDTRRLYHGPRPREGRRRLLLRHALPLQRRGDVRQGLHKADEHQRDRDEVPGDRS